jgi:hypothetical protein
LVQLFAVSWWLVLLFLVIMSSAQAVTFRCVDDLAVDDNTLVSGNVGVGESAPSGDKLYVAGNAGISGDLTIGGSMTYSADLTASGGAVSLIDGTAASPALNFVNDPNTGLFRPATDSLAVSTGGSERLRVASDGNVGPIRKLRF